MFDDFKLANMPAARRVSWSLLIVLLVAGCENGQLVFTDEARQEIKSNKTAAATKRHELFVECLELAAKIERKGDDDVSDIIDECGSEAAYMANHFGN